MKRLTILFAASLTLVAMTGCHDIQNTSGHVLDNANGALKTGDKKLWDTQGERDGQSDGTADPVDSDSKVKSRY